MCTLHERIQTLCKEKGVSAGKMCVELGISKSTISDMKYGRTKGVSVPTAQKISSYFGITVDELYGKEPQQTEKTVTVDSDDLDDLDIQFALTIKQLSAQEKRMFLAQMQAWVASRGQ